MKTELLPCPFCGGEAYDKGYGISCRQCGLWYGDNMTEWTQKTGLSYLERWNKRGEEMDKQFLYNFVPQKGKKTKILCVGTLNFEFKKGDVIFISDEKIVGKLKRAVVDSITRGGIMISGFEDIGVDKEGKTKYRYTEWWCSYNGINYEKNTGLSTER